MRKVNKNVCIILLLIISMVCGGTIIVYGKEGKELTKESLQELVNIKCNVDFLIVGENNININIAGNIELEEAKNISKQIYKQILRKNINNKSIAINFFDEEKLYENEINSFYEEGMNYKINIDSSTKEMIISSFDRSKVKLSEIDKSSEYITSGLELEDRKITVFGETGENILKSSINLNEVIEKLNY